MSYNKRIWANGDLITKERMNNIENGIYDAHDKINVINNKVEENTTNTNTARQDISDIKLQIGTKELNTKSKEIKGAINEVSSQIKDISNLNSIYLGNNETACLALTENTDISDIVNEALNRSNVYRVVLPKGSYKLSSPIIVPANKKLVMQGNYKDNCKFYSTHARTKLTASANNISVIQLKPGAIVEGGYIDISQASNCVGILLNFYNEQHSGTKALQTMILGDRTKNTTAVLMECDDPNGVEKNGYGVFCEFDLHIFRCSIGYHLHRENATWTDGPNDIVWMTEASILGNITHCNRYIWFDTIGGWSGDSSKIHAVLQGGDIVGTDYPAIELDCYGTEIYGTLWDFGGAGLQQKAIKLNKHSKYNYILGENTRTYVEDLGENNILKQDLVKAKNTQNDVLYKNIVNNNDNSIIGNEDKLNYEINIYYKNGSTKTIDNIYSLSYTSSRGFYTDGVNRLEYLFKNPYAGSLPYIYQNMSYDNTVLKLELLIKMSRGFSVESLGQAFTEGCLPKKFKIEVLPTNTNTWYPLIDKSYGSDDNNYNEYGITWEFVNLYDTMLELPFIPKQQVIKEIKFTYEGISESSINPYNQVEMKNIFVGFKSLNPNFTPKYLIDCDTCSVKYKNLENVFGNCVLDVDFSNTDKSIADIFDFDSSKIQGSIENGYATFKSISSSSPRLWVKGASGKHVIVDVSYNFSSTGTIYNINDILSSILSGNNRHLFYAYAPSCLAIFSKQFNSNEYLRIHRIRLYENTGKGNIDYREIESTFSNHYFC